MAGIIESTTVSSKIGAEIKFIARPFLYKGLFIGLLSSIISIFIIYGYKNKK